MRSPFLIRSLLTLALACVLCLPGLAQGQAELPAEQVLASIPVQSGGRLKPLDTLARETVRLVTGKATWQGSSPVMTMLGWWAKPEEAAAAKIIEFRDVDSKAVLGLDSNERWFSFNELKANKKLIEARETIHQRLKADEELQGTDKKIQELLIKMATLEATEKGSILAAVPNPSGMSETWGSFEDLSHVNTVALVAPAKAAVASLKQALAKGDLANLAPAATAVHQELAKIGPVPDASALEREVQYNECHPFQKAWILYLCGLLVLIFVKPDSGRTPSYWLGFSLIGLGFIIHTYGFVIRCIIAGRPPVTNMYESVIWVAFGAVLFSFIFEILSPKRWYLMSSAAVAVVCLVLADILPAVLDPSIHPLTPVLRSNFWLSIHVLTITLGYAGFLLALGLGHIVLWKSATRTDQKEQLNTIHQALYRAVQVGVICLAAGTILGGVWASYSWGRFWGWDPKEVWALIALLGYLAILHGRYAGWLKKFGIAAWSIIAFQGVLMAWYGVNYILGAGLHSYGFGTGGYRYVAIYVSLEIAFVVWAAWRHRRLNLPHGFRG